MSTKEVVTNKIAEHILEMLEESDFMMEMTFKLASIEGVDLTDDATQERINRELRACTCKALRRVLRNY